MTMVNLGFTCAGANTSFAILAARNGVPDMRTAWSTNRKSTGK